MTEDTKAIVASNLTLAYITAISSDGSAKASSLTTDDMLGYFEEFRDKIIDALPFNEPGTIETSDISPFDR